MKTLVKTPTNNNTLSCEGCFYEKYLDDGTDVTTCVADDNLKCMEYHPIDELNGKIVYFIYKEQENETN